ncbi:MAG: type I DNA topoisomerase [Bacteroidales bacterium]|jgi:DNA topoisomerase-1|nr:type I DNA topoisomerase [Bacteroidales bacterium]
MSKNLVIVESPAKAKTIEKYLGKEYKVLSSYGHVRDLPKGKMCVDIEHDFKPEYEISEDKKKLVAELAKEAKNADMVWLASDEDREGEAIAWHLSEVLKLDKAKTKRIVFNEITKTAILHAIEHPRQLDENLTNAQQARRVLDRLVGYEISPVLWKKVRPSLSAGRVQSVAVRLIVDREKEIKKFEYSSAFRVTSLFDLPSQKTLEAELNKRFKDDKEIGAFLEHCKTAIYTVADIETKPSKRTPAAPFTTSTLQQEASRKLGFSVAKTMLVAQQLYEAGYITYMRTDSVHLSDLAIHTTQSAIEKNYGAKYHKMRQYATKSKGAQEAHEAIRPTYIDNQKIEGDASQQRLYDLIWKRTIASQMSDAEFEKTTVTIDISNCVEKFQAKGEVLIFDGFLKVYMESKDEEDDSEVKGLLPPINVHDRLSVQKITARQTFTQAPPRYTEASLVKKMEELGIGRPSTYAPTISTIQKREYVVKEDRDGNERTYKIMELDAKGNIQESNKTEVFGAEKSKMFPTDIGNLVTQFLVENFDTIIDFNFTAEVEKEFDEVANGDIQWTEMLRQFYKPFHEQVDTTLQNSERVRGERLVGVDTKTGKNIYVRLGRFGPMAQIGETSDEEKPTFASLKKGQSLETITLEEVLDLFKLPRTVGQFEGEDLVVAIGRFGPYIRLGKTFYPLGKVDDPLEVSEERVIEIIKEKREKDANKVIREFKENPDVHVLNGRFGPYVAVGKKNFKIPKTVDPASLTLQDCLDLSEGQKLAAEGDAKPVKKAAAKKPAAKKAAPKKATKKS